jgi:hypothetical protein
MSAISEISNVASTLFDAVKEYAERNGQRSLANYFQDASYWTGEAATFSEEHPYEAAAAFLAGIAVVTVVAPELIAAGAESIAASTAMRAVASGITDAAIAAGVDGTTAAAVAQQAITITTNVFSALAVDQSVEYLVTQYFHLTNGLIDLLGGFQDTKTNSPQGTYNFNDFGDSQKFLFIGPDSSGNKNSLAWSIPSSTHKPNSNDLTVFNGDNTVTNYHEFTNYGDSAFYSFYSN